jgi:carbohydrate kinase (thermoresistant glucokinase family)
MQRIVVMGVSGAGKTTVGSALAERLGLRFQDADDLHPDANVAKMAAGTPLDDADRAPWLAVVGDALAAADEPGMVMACSALKRPYRDAIRARAGDARFVLLTAPVEVLRERIGHRSGHFMPATLLDSQLATLEPLGADESGVTVDVSGTLDANVDAVVRAL